MKNIKEKAAQPYLLCKNEEEEGEEEEKEKKGEIISLRQSFV